MSEELSLHLSLLNDADRMQAYRRAILKTVRPGDTVLDIGTGTGIMALFSCQAGAKRVYAVDKGDIITVSRELAKANNLDDRILFMKEEIRKIRLEEKVDVITSELIAKGVLGEDMAGLVGWCRDRFLKPAGKLLPQRVELRVAPIEDEKIYRKSIPPVQSLYDVNLRPLEQLYLNKAQSARIPLSALLAQEQTVYSYQAMTSGPVDSFEATLVFEPERTGTVHGLGGWFSAVLAEGIELTNKPPGIHSWDNLFLPLAEPVQVAPGMAIELYLRGKSDGHVQNFWIWNTTVRRDGQVLAKHKQSSFAGRIFTTEMLRKASDLWKPATNLNGRVAQLTLNMMDQGLSLQDMADRVVHDFPDRFDTTEEALALVRKIAKQFGD
jgi:hypothetical protein